MKILDWVRRHPQMTTSFLLGLFTQVQGSLALADLKLPPLASWGINSAFATTMFVLAFVNKNVKDDDLNTPSGDQS